MQEDAEHQEDEIVGVEAGQSDRFEKPITPVIGSSDAEMLAALAWSCAADDEIPSVKP
jgi:hypothetical protein